MAGPDTPPATVATPPEPQGGQGGGSGATQAVLAIGLRLSGAVLGMAMHITLARLMTLEAYGGLVLALTLATLVSVFASLGMPFCAIRFLPRYLARPGGRLVVLFERLSLAVTAFGIAVAIALGLLGLLLFADHLPPALVQGIWGAIPLALTLGFAQTLHALMIAQGRIVLADCVQSVARPVLCIAAALLLARNGALSLEAGLGILVGVGMLVALVLAVAYPFAKRGATPTHLMQPRTRQVVRHWVRVGLVIVLTASAVAMLERIDILIVGILLGSEEAAIYSAASRMAMVGAIVVGAANAAFGPRLAVAVPAGNVQDARALAFKAALLPTLALVPFLGGALLLGDWVLGFFGPEFRAGWPVLCVLAGAQLMMATFGATGGIAIFAKGERVVIKAVLTGLAADLVLNLLLVPVLGGIGAAIGSLLAMALIFGWIAVWCKRSLGYSSTLWP